MESGTRIVLALLFAWGGTADAKLKQLVVTSTESPTFEGRSFGAAGQYERVNGYAIGEVDPNAPGNAGVVNIENAPRNARGMVEYRVEVQILKPIDMSKSNGWLFYDVNNRGNKLALRFVNDAPFSNDPVSADSAGNGYLMNEGYVIVWSGWQGDVATGGGRLTARFPVATHNGAPIVGTVREEFIPEHTKSPFVGRLAYPAANLDPSQAVLTVRLRERDPRETPPGLSWRFVDAKRIEIVRPTDSRFDAGAIFEFVYSAKDPVVMGLGFVATRDVISFLRYAAADSSGASNPLASGTSTSIRHAMGFGVSQSGRFLRDFLYQGFNQDEDGRQAFDAIAPLIAGSRKTFTNYAFSQPGRYSRQHEDHLFPGDQFPFSYGLQHDPVSGRTDGLLASCTASNTCPKVFHLDSDTEIWQARGSLVVTDTAGNDVALPENVRAYLFAGTQHGPAARPARGICQQLSNPMDYKPFLRGLLRSLREWASTGESPPPSQYGSTAQRTLVRPSPGNDGFPSIPAVRYDGLYNSLAVLDHSFQPPLAGAEYPVFVSAVDGDGNGVAGLRHPFHSVATATTTGWNLRAAGFAEGELCSLNGSYIPFASTRAERMASGDPRPSIEERYPHHGAYVSRVARAAGRLVQQRYLLPEDAEAIIESAAESSIGQ